MPQKRRKRPWGSITEVVRGEKQVIRWVEDTPRGRVRRSRTLYCTYKEADAELARIRVAVESRGGSRPAVTVGHAYEAWYLPAMRQRVEAGSLKESTFEHYSKVWLSKVAPRWRSCPATEAFPIDIEEWLQGMTKANGKLCKAVLMGVFDECAKRRVVPSNPARVRMIPSSLGSSMDKGRYDIEQLDEIAWRLRGHFAACSVVLMGFGSCRLGESLGPRMDEVRFEECGGMRFAIVDVRRQVRADGTPSDDGDLKNPQSERPVCVPWPWCLVLARRVREAKPWEVYLSDDGTGNPMPQHRIRNAWNGAFSSELLSGIEQHPLKNLRPSWQTWMNWRNHVPRERIEKMMGHVGSGVTAQFYDRPLVGQFMDEVARSFADYPYESGFDWDSLGIFWDMVKQNPRSEGGIN